MIPPKSHQNSDYIVLSTCRVELVKDCYVHIKFFDNIEVDIDDAKELVDEVLRLTKGCQFVILADARDIFSSITHEARKYIAEHVELNKYNTAQAILANNTPIRLLVNFYLSFYDRTNPGKIFRDEKNADKWLNNYYKDI